MIVRTGSQFVVLGEEIDDLMEMDVYNFLYMISSTGGTNSNTACPDEEVDALMEVDEGTDCGWYYLLRIRSWWSNVSGWNGRLLDLRGS